MARLDIIAFVCCGVIIVGYFIWLGISIYKYKKRKKEERENGERNR